MIKVNGEDFAWSPGLSVQDVLDEKKFTFRLISVWINGEPVADRENYALAPIPDGAEVEIVHMMSGG